MDKRLIGEWHDFEGLRLVHLFSWMRAKELGMMLWPKSLRSAVNASELISKWRREKWVLERALPSGTGKGLVLSTAGAAYLREQGCSDAQTGKDWGETHHGKWHAPLTWKHELMTLGLMAQLKREGWQVIPERQLRRENNATKFPDGLAVWGDKVLWIEVENARKTGKNRTALLLALILASRGMAEPMSGLVANQAMLAFATNTLDERGYRVNHRDNVIAALAARAPVDISLKLAELTVSGVAGVDSLRTRETLIESAAISQRLERIFWRHYPETAELLTNDYFTDGGLDYRHGDSSYGIWWSVRRGETEIASGDVSSAEEAKRALVADWIYRETQG